jgi:hypothetical protein
MYFSPRDYPVSVSSSGLVQGSGCPNDIVANSGSELIAGADATRDKLVTCSILSCFILLTRRTTSASSTVQTF